MKSDSFEEGKVNPITFEFTLTLGDQVPSIEKELVNEDEN